MAQNPNNLFKRLTQLFRSGPITQRKLEPFKGASHSSALDLFKKSQSHVYSNAINAYGQYDRMARYADFSEMEYTPEIASALDIYSHEACAQNEQGRVLHIYSDNEKIKEILDNLFMDVLNIEFNLASWTRNLCKYGDFFLFNDVAPSEGIINVFPIPVNEIEREEGFDPEDPLAVRFRWVTQGNQILENWQISHFRLLGNDAFLPYGASMLEAARRIWRQLILVEDSMLVYRVVRSPERRVFYIDVGNVPPEDIPVYMEQAKATLKSSQVVDKNTGRVDLRYNPLSVDEDYFLPVRGTESGTKIDTLAGGQNTTAIEDVEYIQKKLFAALKIPRAYLGYDEALSSKATLAQEDIRFSRTINNIQRILLSELNKLAIIQLFTLGYESEDLLNFDLRLSNPSTIAQQQKLELYRTKFEIAAQSPEGLLSKHYLRKNVIGLNNKEISEIEEEREEERTRDLEIESISLPGQIGDDEGPGLVPPSDDMESGEPEALGAGQSRDIDLMLAELDDDDEEDFSDLEVESEKAVKPSATVRIQDKLKWSRKRRRPWAYQDPTGPRLSDMTKPDSDPFDAGFFKTTARSESLRKAFESVETNEDENSLNNFFDDKIIEHARMTSQISSMLKRLDDKIDISRSTPSIITEFKESEEQNES